MNEEGNRLYAAGDNGSHVINVNGPNLKRSDLSRLDKRSTTVEVVNGNNVITQEPNTNQLELNDPNLTELKQIDGLFEDGRPAEDLHDYRHSLDHKYFLWRSGQDNLTIVDADKFEAVDVIKQFWTYEKRSTMPVCAASNRQASKIVGASQAGPDNYIIHYYEDDPPTNIAFARPIQDIIPSMYKVTCMDVSFDEQRVYIGGLLRNGTRSGDAVVIACEFNQTLREISGKKLDDVFYGTPHRLKRVLGSTEQMIVACDKHFAVMEFTGGELIQIGSIRDIHENEISDFVVRDRFLYSKAVNEPDIKVTELNTGEIYTGPPPATTTDPLRNPPPPTIRRDPPLVRDPLIPPEVAGGAFDGLNTRKNRYTGFFKNKSLRDEALYGLEKVVVNSSGDILYTGGRGLHVFRNSGGGRMVPSDLDLEKGEFYFLYLILLFSFYFLNLYLIISRY